MASRNPDVKEAGSNLFAHFGIADATEKNTKVQLAVAINEIIRQRKLKQKDAAATMSCTQPDVSHLRHYKLSTFSIERLIDFLLALDNDVEITIRRRHSGESEPAHTVVRLEAGAAA